MGRLGWWVTSCIVTSLSSRSRDLGSVDATAGSACENRAMGSRSIEDYVASRVEAAIAASPPEADVYVFSLWVSYVDDDPRRPEVWFGSNTEAQVESSLIRASDEAEARWNFAFWRQNQIVVIGGEDWRGAEMFSAWFQYELGRWFTDEDETADPDTTYETCAQMEFHFFRKMADVSAVLHERGVTLGPGGRRIPIIVHELEYHDEIAIQNARANPSEILPVEFLSFCRGETGDP
jgi:hypothetical protein